MEPSRTKSKVKLDELLLRHGAITAEQLAQAHAEQKKWGGDLGHVLVELGFIPEALLMKAYAHLMGIPLCNPAVDAIPDEFVKAVGVQVCERYGVIPVGGDLKKKKLVVATSEPTKTSELAQVSQLTGYKVEAAAATADSIARGIRKHYWGEAEAPQDDHRPASFVTESVRPTLSEIPAQPPPPTVQYVHVHAPPAPVAAPPPPPPPPADPGPGIAALNALMVRVAKLEQQVRPLENQVQGLLASNPEFAGVTSRVERLEQLIASEGNLVRVLSEFLVEKGLVTRDELFARVLQKGAG